jgi:hypothetical protein
MEKREGNFKILEYTNVHFLICEAGFCFVVLAGLNENGGNWVSLNGCWNFEGFVNADPF